MNYPRKMKCLRQCPLLFIHYIIINLQYTCVIHNDITKHKQPEATVSTKIGNQSMKNINNIIEKNTWNFTRSPW